MTTMPDGVALDQAIIRARAGELGAQQFAQVFSAATLMVAVTAHEETADADAALPFVIEVNDAPFGVAFTSPAQFETFTAQTPFVLLDGSALGSTWPGELGLAINPGSEPSLFLAAAQLQALLDALAGPGVQGSIPAGTGVRIGAPADELDPAAAATIAAQVRLQPAVRAAYQVAIAQGDADPELVIGVEPMTPGDLLAQKFAATVSDAAPELAAVAFIDLRGRILESVQRHCTPIA